VPGAALPLLAFYFGLGAAFTALVPVFILYLIISFVIVREGGGFKGVFARFFGVLYVSLLLAHFISLRSITDGTLWLLLAMIIVWAGDTGAYYGGRSFGKKKLAPSISPNKTVEGALSGLVSSMVAALIFVLVTGLDFPIVLTLFLSLIAGIAGIFGDLTESYIKRWAGVKDSGTLIPGHGGLLDRIDSVLFSVPIVFYFIYLSSLVR